MLKAIGCLSAVLVFLAGSALAQKPVEVAPVTGENPPGQSGPIQLDVVVTDKAGHPIAGLQQGDFTLLDNRQPATIQSFAAHALDNPAVPSEPESAVLLIDDVNASFNVVSIERTQIEQFLRSSGGHLAVPMAIFFLTDKGVEQITPVSADGTSLANTLHQREGQLHDMPRAGFWGAAERIEISLRALDSVAQFESRRPGRKLLIWVSPGWAVFDNPNVIVTSQQQRSFFSMIVDFSTRLRQAQVTLYSVDPLGTWDAAGPRTFLWENYMKPVTKENKSNTGNLALEVMAFQSGGKVLSGSNNVAGEIAQCVEDASAWYTLSFDPQRADAPNTWHSVEVKVDKPGLKVRTRNGYYAQP
jgi:VWFA-related protein